MQKEEESGVKSNRAREWFAEHEERIRKYLGVILRRHNLGRDYQEVLNDCVAEIFYTIARREETGPPGFPPYAWLASLSVNIVLSGGGFGRGHYQRTRSGQKKRECSACGGQESAVEANATTGRWGPADEATFKLTLAEVLQTLSEPVRAVVIAKWEGYKRREIAALLGVHKRTVSYFTARARRVLRLAFASA